MSLTLAIISDLHHGPDVGSKQGSRAGPVFERFCSWLGTSGAHYVVDLGDRISNVSSEVDQQLMSEVAGWFSKVKLPRAHLLGNHDVKLLSIQDNERIYGFSFGSRSVDINGYHLVFWNACSRLDPQLGFSLQESDFEWIRDDLNNTQLPSVVFTHVPLDNGSMRGNFYFDKAYPHQACYPLEQGERVREILEKSERVVLCINGHTHWNAYHSIDGIHYVTVPSPVELFPTYPLACESWTKLELENNSISIQVLGNLPITYKLAFEYPKNRHWLNLHKTYAPQVAEPK